MNWNSLRKEFPALNQVVSGKNVIYFDNACNTLRPRQVINAIIEYYEQHPACAGKRSSHHFSKETQEKCVNARGKIAAFIRAKPNEIVWTKNSTEAINLVAGSIQLKKGENVVCSILDHHSLMLPFHRKCCETRAKMKIIECNSEGKVSMEKWQNAINKKTGIVLVTHASNVAGTIQPAREIIKIAHENNALALVDGAQFAPHNPLNVKKLDADFYCFSMHKMLGPSGMGVLYGKEEKLAGLEMFMVGGDTIRDVVYTNGKIFPKFLPPPKKFEAGLQDYAGIIGSGKAIDFLQGIGMNKVMKRDRELSGALLKGLSQLNTVEVIGPKNKRGRVATVSFHLKKKISPKDVAEYFDTQLKKYIIMLRAGVHCANPFHYFIGLNPKKGEGTVRASLYFYNSMEEIETFIVELKKLVNIVD